MTSFIGVAVLCAIAGAYAGLARRRLEEMLPLAAGTVIGILYLSGLLGDLNMGRYGCVLAGGIAAVGCAAFLLKRGRAYLAQVLTPGLLGFGLLVLFLWYMSQGRLYQQWDDFSHWGLVVKNMCYFDQLGNIAESTVKFKEYPPAASLFAYFCTSFGHYSETNAIRGMGYLTVAFLAPVFAGIRGFFPAEGSVGQKDAGGEDAGKGQKGASGEGEGGESAGKAPWPCLIPLMALVYLLPTSLHRNTYAGLYVDAFLAVLFFYLIYAAFTYRGTRLRLLSMGTACALLVLTKESGLGLAAIALLLIGVGQSLLHRDRRRKAWLEVLACAAVCAAAQLSWKLYLTAANTVIESSGAGGGFSLAALAELFAGQAPSYRYETIRNFGAFLFTEPMGGLFVMFPIAVWIVIFAAAAVLFLYVCRRRGERRLGQEAAVIFWGLLAGFAVYMLSLLVLYLFSYSEFEALRLASAQRYLSMYLTGMLCCFGLFYLRLFTKWRLLGYFGVLACVFLCSTRDGVDNVILYPKESVLTSQWLWEGYAGAQRFQDKLDYQRDRVYVIAQNDEGIDYWVLRGVFTPVQINPNYSWSIGESYGPQDVFTAYKNIYSWSDDLEEYTYVYLFRVDDKFREQFGALFENPADIADDTMFRIEHGAGPDGLALLVKDEEMTAY